MAQSPNNLEHQTSHEPNLDPPYPDSDFLLVEPDGVSRVITTEELSILPRATVGHCYIISTGHGTSGPFDFSGVKITDVIHHKMPNFTDWSQVAVIGADGFGTRFQRHELIESNNRRSIILADSINGQSMTRKQGLVRLIVPGEKDDALRQVKWVAQIHVH